MKRKPVVSSVLRSVGYSPTLLVLEVEFVGQEAIYQYHDVPLEIYKNLMDASSHGQYFNVNIKNQFPFTKKD